MKSNKTENDLINFHEVLVIGLGYIGLPTAALIASKSVKVLGFDINSDVVNTINRGEIHIVEPDLKNSVSEAVKKKNLIASNKPLKANNYLIVVPTPFKGKNEPDISFVEATRKHSGDCEVAYNLMHLSSLQSFRESISNNVIGNVQCVRSIVGQYLTDWRKDAD